MEEDSYPDERMRLFSMVDVLEPLSQAELTDVAGRCPDVRLRQGRLIYAEEDAAEALYLLLEGRVRIYSTWGGRELTTMTLASGTVFGTDALAPRRRRRASAQTLEPSRICRLGLRALHRLVRGNPEVGLKVMGVLAERLSLLEDRMADLGLKDVPSRLASLILQLLETEGIVTGEGYVLPPHYTHRELGAMIGANRVAVTRAFAQLRRAGAVQTRDRTIYITRRGALERIAGGR